MYGKKITAIMLTIMMTLAILPVQAMADEEITGGIMLDDIEVIEGDTEQDNPEPGDPKSEVIREENRNADSFVPEEDGLAPDDDGLTPDGDSFEATCGGFRCLLESDDHTAVILGRGEGNNDTEITIPATVTYEEVQYSVTGIDGNAFSDDENITKLTVEEGVTEIGAGAFYACKNLSEITLPDSITTMNYDSFQNTAYDGDYKNWENGVLYIGKWLVLGSRIGNNSIVNIKPGTKAITSGAFIGAGKQEEGKCFLTVPQSVTGIPDYAVYSEASLYGSFGTVSIAADSDFEIIGQYSFEGCRGLTSVYIPASVKDIGHGAFSRSGLKSIVLPKGLKCIEQSMFLNCQNLEEVIIPASVTEIGDQAFNECDNLTTIRYGGTEEQWNAITGDGKTITPTHYNTGSYTFTVTGGANVCLAMEEGTGDDGARKINATCYDPGYTYGTVEVKKAGNEEGKEYDGDTEGENLKFSFTAAPGDYEITVPITPKSGSVSFDKKGGSGEMDTRNMTTGDIVPECTFTPPEGKRFMHWISESRNYYKHIFRPGDKINVLDNEMTLEAAWGDEKFAVQFFDDTGKHLKTEIVGWKESATAPEAPSKEGYQFVGWDKTFDEVTSDLAVNAKFSKIYTVTTSAEGGGTAAATPASGIKGTNVTIEAKPDDGYDFKEWKVVSGDVTLADNKKATTTLEIPESDVEVKAIFEKKPEKVAAPVFSPAGGIYTGAQNVKISCATQGVKIYYTTDGSNPTTGSKTYSAPISVTASATIKAIAVKDGMTDSEISSATYTINKPEPEKSYTVNVTIDGNGTATASPKSGTTGTEVKLTAIPNNGYEFKEWTVVSGGVKLADPKKAETTFKIKNSDVKVKAAFVKKNSSSRTSIKNATVKLSKSSLKYNGKAQKPTVKSVKLNGKTLDSKNDYTVSWSNSKSKKRGTYTVTITGKGNYKDSKTVNYKIVQGDNPLNVTAVKKEYTVKYSNLAKKDQTIKKDKIFNFKKNGAGKITYSLSSAKKGKKSFKKFFSISNNGKLKIMKGLEKGTYSVKINVKAKGDKNYKEATKTVKFTVRVKK